MSTPKNGDSSPAPGSAAALAAALNGKLVWKSVSAVTEAVKATASMSDIEKTILRELLSAGDDVVLAIIEASADPNELLSDLATFVRSTIAEQGGAPTPSSSSSSSSSSAPNVPAPVVVPTPTPSATSQTPTPLTSGAAAASLNSPNSATTAAASTHLVAPTPVVPASVTVATKFPMSSPPLSPSTPDLSSASPMILSAASSPAPALALGGGAVPSLSLSDGKSTSQQLKDVETAYESAFKLLTAHADKDKGKERDTVKTGLRSIVKMLENLKRHPNQLQYRKLRMDNIVVKKYVSGVDGAQTLMEAVGFRKIEVGTAGKKILYLAIEEADTKPEVIDRACELIGKQLELLDKPAPAPAPAAAAAATGPKTLCTGGCGFFGDAGTNGMCSLCWKKKNPTAANEKTPTSSSSSSSSAAKPATPAPGKPTGLCTKGCGFFGNESYKGMCSSCYNANKATVKKTWKKHIHIAMIKLRAMRQFTVLTKKPIQKQKNRCWKCARKIGITGIECRCGYIFCAAHRYANEHDCDFDHKELQRKKLTKENQEVKGKKLTKIGEPDNS